MSEQTKFLLPDLLEPQLETVLNDWLRGVVADWQRHYSQQVINEDALRWQSQQVLDALIKMPNGLWDGSLDFAPDSRLITLMRDFAAQQTKKDFKPANTASYVLILKRLLFRVLHGGAVSSDDMWTGFENIARITDRLIVLIYDVYIENRERTIAQQSLSLLDLATPVVRLWDQMVMVPLVGVLDTMRARQTTERLLEAVTKYEATVAIIDVTGVPVLDTSVASHLMKTIAASQMLGAQVVMTGISPEGAQTLVKLGVNFSEVTTRATLRAGIAEGLHLIGRRIVPVQDT